MKRTIHSDLARLRLFAPAELVPESGVYEVIHSDHRARHESTLLAGTRFPICKSCGAEVRFRLIMAVKRPQVPSVKSPSILLADSDRISIRSVAAVLEAEGYEIKVVANENKAIEQLHLEDYDAIIAGLNPEEESAVFDLLTLAKKIQPNTVLLMYVGDPTPENLRKLLARVDYCIVKPLDATEVTSALTTLIARRQAAAASLSY
jgi:CheY-like chemotaxis protein